eukprot:TRINITY_DN74300_c0_g1_i1.p1 TRINITY_DN74300_c0_g1~~TRINITY_DN74300_c0_g1_i1.p1  ORF type:complete len:309 (-),score=44.50 TRINITY_DN74300_c0_g1_i1:399-1229(-)
MGSSDDNSSNSSDAEEERPRADDRDNKKFEDVADCQTTMKEQLLKLQAEDPGCVFICRKIKKLGFDSPDALRTYFSKTGPVRAILVSHSRGRTNAGGSGGSSSQFRRPAAIGFCLMANADDAAKILAAKDHNVDGVEVTVQAFRHVDEFEAEQKKEQNQKQASDQPKSKRQRVRESRESRTDSPTCPTCDSTIAVNLGFARCVICDLRSKMYPPPGALPPPAHHPPPHYPPPAASHYPPPPAHYPAMPPHGAPPPGPGPPPHHGMYALPPPGYAHR